MCGETINNGSEKDVKKKKNMLLGDSIDLRLKRV